MKKLILCIILLSITGCSILQMNHDYKVKQIYLEYKSHNKMLEIKDTSLVITDIKYFFDNPMSSIPSDTQSKTSDYTLTEKEINDLILFIQENRFFDLENQYGAPESERSYATSILIQIQGREKTVVFRSNPAYKLKPDSFDKIESYILTLRK